MAAVAVLAVAMASCKSSQDKAIEAAKQKAAQTGQEQQEGARHGRGQAVHRVQGLDISRAAGGGKNFRQRPAREPVISVFRE